MDNPIYKDGKFYKRAGYDLKLLGGGGKVELLVDSKGNHRYYLDGNLHRADGPALITSGGYAEWYVNGKQIHPVWLETRAKGES